MEKGANITPGGSAILTGVLWRNVSDGVSVMSSVFCGHETSAVSVLMCSPWDRTQGTGQKAGCASDNSLTWHPFCTHLMAPPLLDRAVAASVASA